MKRTVSVGLGLTLLAAGTLLFSCGSSSKTPEEVVQETVQKGVEVAGDAGLIDKDAANAISGALAEITPEEEYYIGRAVGANILTNYPIDMTNQALVSYLNDICVTLVINSPKPSLYNGYHVAILDSDEINAFATSGGHVFLTRGLVASATSEDALAAVIAHEISHIQLQHSLKSIKTSRFGNALSASADAAGMDVGEKAEIFGSSVNDITSSITNGYSQTQEFDADSNALKLLTSAGYTPSALVEMLNSLKEKQASSPGVGFAKTHPSPEQRITNVNLTVGNYQTEDTRTFRQPRFAAIH
ncbi:MAG: M48 family metalloprotease [Treponema sp.]|jgi:predicted Zn-dependent protease|nr:M48 family metalloprotease [Treponema sp.]